MNGIIVINKPLGRTSHDMVSFMRRLTKIKRIGHTGTLDPMAEGVLPICIGNATKVADMLTLSDKCYRAELVLGMITDTLDSEGEILSECEVNCTEEEIRSAIMSFVGEIEQIPPMYSAIKQNGQKLYELARKGVEVERKPRRVTINSIDIEDIDMENHIVKISVSCSKGTYIRTLCEDIGIKLRVGAYMNKLTRTKTGQFTIEDAKTTKEIEQMVLLGTLEENLVMVDEIFADLPQINLNPKQTKSVVNGVQMTWHNAKEGETFRVYGNDGKFLCISEIKDGRLKTVKSFR